MTSLRRLSMLLKLPSSTSLSSSSSYKSCSYVLVALRTLSIFENSNAKLHYITSRSFCSQPLNPDEGHAPSAIGYHSVLQEDEFHSLADSTIHDLQEKLEEYGDTFRVDGFDVD